MVDAQRIQQIVSEIARRFRPDRIILFGSYAYGTPTEDSDVDLLVVMPADGRDTRKAIEIRRFVQAGVAMDLLVYAPVYLQQRIDWEDWFVREITEKGRVLYESRSRRSELTRRRETGPLSRLGAACCRP